MQQESQPLVALQNRQSAMKSRANTFSTLATRTSALQNAAEALSDSTSMAAFKATSNDPTAVAVSAGSSALAGRYDIVVNELARSQVMASSSRYRGRRHDGGGQQRQPRHWRAHGQHHRCGDIETAGADDQ